MYSFCLYTIRQLIKAIIGLEVKIIFHSYKGDNSHSENRQYIVFVVS